MLFIKRKKIHVLYVPNLRRHETATLTGHQKYIHAASHCAATGLVASASEDGSVRLWDARIKKPCTATLVPSTRSELARSKCGQWVGAVCLTSDWVVRTRTPISQTG